jgi:NAD(P)-dependent dehydrogenase (short-subunit alcohol dehydrogenase family)
MDLGLKGRRVLITGGSKGIGYAIAEMLASEGCRLVLTARDEKALKEAKDKLNAQYPGIEVVTHAADLSKEPATRELAAKFPDIDVLVNNAGAIRTGSLHEIDDPTWRSYWDLKVYGYINMTRNYYALMKQRRSGVIINIIGVAGERLRPDYIAGSTGNASLIAFTRAMGQESARDNVRVVGVNPGPVLTEKLMLSLRKTAQVKFGDAEKWEELIKTMPFGRPIRPVEISAMVALLASDLSGYTTGTVVTIDGGGHKR